MFKDLKFGVAFAVVFFLNLEFHYCPVISTATATFSYGINKVYSYLIEMQNTEKKKTKLVDRDKDGNSR